MNFVTLTFAVFFAIFFILYWFVFNRSLMLQNLFILIGSYFFYAWWDWRFLSLLIGSSAITYYIGIGISTQNEKNKRLLLYVGLAQGLGMLFFFKYFNFFIDSLNSALSFFHIALNLSTIHLILPLGISFYTFRILSYLIDIYNGKINPVKNLVVLSSYIGFFPSLISGPIDRAKTLIPQLENKRAFDRQQILDGIRQILWGLIKKIVVADNCARITNDIFANYSNLSSSTLILGAFYFTVQLYADLSGYSDMAIGFARLLGFNITKNFDFPFFSRNIAEFWRKWHISLTSWLTDYVFSPLTIIFRDFGKLGLILAILINFIIIGFWHGPNWTFILFGFLHGCFYIPLILRGKLNKKAKVSNTKLLPSYMELFGMIRTFLLVMFTCIFFKADSLQHAFAYIGNISLSTLFSFPQYVTKSSLFFIIFLLLAEWLQRSKEHALQIDEIRFRPFRMAIYYILVLLVVFFSVSEPQEFIYFQF